MSNHGSTALVRHCDVAIVGGAAAGLAAAVQLARQRRSVIVVDAGAPRNAPAAHMHGYLGFDGAAPATLLDTGRDEVRSYGGEVLPGRVDRVQRVDGGRFLLDLSGGAVRLSARRVVVATGVVDELPAIDGVRDGWGDSVIHCPFCHGYEVRDRRVVQVVTLAAGIHSAGLFRQLTDRLTVILDGPVEVPPDEIERLVGGGVTVERGTVVRIAPGGDDGAAAIELDDGRRFDADAVVVTPAVRARIEPFEPVGLVATAHPAGFGTLVEVDETGQTSVAGLYAAGNVTDPSQQVAQAAANGSRVGAMVGFDLATEDLDSGDRRSGNELDWESRYGGEAIWSGNPNGTLVDEMAGSPAGRALDVGAGEGGDAIWLAEQGWAVVAADIAEAGLGRLRAEAARRGLTVDCRRVDANALDPFDGEVFDLVTAFYASIPRTPDRRAVANLLDAVAPGGTLLVVGHDLEPMRAPIDPAAHSRAFDPDAYVRVDDLVAAVEGSADWEIECHGRRARPAGSASAAHHVDDVVLRARRGTPPITGRRGRGGRG